MEAHQRSTDRGQRDPGPRGAPLTLWPGSAAENAASLVLFYIPSAENMKIIFENYTDELMKYEQRELTAKLKSEKYSPLIFSLLHPFSIDLKFNIS